jgi:glycosyltransferase involved in cell wall biosynthesis
LIAHYLPTLVARGAVPDVAELSSAERAALAAADGFLAPSEFMARALLALGAAPRPVRVVGPGLDVDSTLRASSERARAAGRAALEAVVVANLVPGKGVLPFLDALAPHLRAGAPLRVNVIGSLVMDPAYAEACRTRVTGDPALAGNVCFAGALPHATSLARVAASDLLVSASRMESFGLALAEARAIGVPILARDGGNARAHVSSCAGGELCGDDAALAAACARLACDPGELARRRAAARAERGPVRSWADGAHDFLALNRDWTNVPVTERASAGTRSTPASSRSRPAAEPAAARGGTRRRS